MGTSNRQVTHGTWYGKIPDALIFHISYKNIVLEIRQDIIIHYQMND